MPKDPKDGVVRFQVDLSPERVLQIEELMEITGISTKRELFNNALALLDWATREAHSGRSIVSMNDEDQRIRELAMPALDHAREKGSGNIKGSESGG